MTSFNRGINNELVMKMKEKAKMDNIGANKAKGIGAYYAIEIIVGLHSNIIKGVTIILFKHINKNLNEMVIIPS